MSIVKFLFSLFLLFALVGDVFAAVPSVDRPIAILRALDKITARVEEIEVPIGVPYRFGTIFITVHSCRVTTPEEQPESAAFMDVTAQTEGEVRTIFTGWMFASSPALSAMEDPVYDLWLMGCRRDPRDKDPSDGQTTP